MPYIEWSSTFELGMDEFDGHHKFLVELLNMTYDGLICEAPRDELGGVLDELIGYAGYHFAAEEHWMEMHNYPDAYRHREEHKTFSAKIGEFQKDFYEGKADLSFEVLQFLNDWLFEHIVKSDAGYGRFAERLPPAARD